MVEESRLSYEMGDSNFVPMADGAVEFRTKSCKIEALTHIYRCGIYPRIGTQLNAGRSGSVQHSLVA